ncbi:MAG: TlyA family RNA methyltransferase, partial [Roseiflexaceae bacterium]|nr:TlyA family RNA methyltransferase [Roseiflexaceae bacterium]
MKKVRIDQLVVQRGLAPSRAKAQALIMSGAVQVAGVKRDKAGELVAPDADVTISAAMPYVSRGGYKLAHALDTFGLDPVGLVALDAGASTGGFSDVLLQRGAAHVFAVDVGYGILDWKVRSDPRVTAVDRTNIRYLEQLPPLGTTGDLPDQQRMPTLADCAVIDTSFI